MKSNICKNVEEITWNCTAVKMVEGAHVNYVMLTVEITVVVE